MYKQDIRLFSTKKSDGARLHKSRCDLFIESWWIFDGSVSGFHLSSFKTLSHSHIALQSEVVCWREKLWQADFQSTEGMRESLERLEAPRWELAEWKQNVRDARCQDCSHMPASVCVWLPDSSNRPRFYLKRSNCCWRLSLVFSNLCNLSFFPWLPRTEVRAGNGDVQECRSASKTENHHL